MRQPLLMLLLAAAAAAASAQTSVKPAAPAANAPKPTAPARSTTSEGFVYLPEEIRCSLKGLNYRSMVGSNGELANTNGSVSGITCHASGKSEGPEKQIDLALTEITGGMLPTKQFGNLLIQPVNSLTSSGLSIAIERRKLNALRKFLGVTDADSTPVAKLVPVAAPTAAKLTATAPPVKPTVPAWVKLPHGVPAAKGIVKTAFALRYQDIKIGTGPDAEPNKMYKVFYIGWLAVDGRKFDATDDHPRAPELDKDGKPVLDANGKPKQGDPQPISFPQGFGRVIPGWDQGFEGMKIGGKRRIFIPWQLAYGARGRPGPDAAHPGIPAKADLIFDVELVDVVELPMPPNHPAIGGMPGARPMGGAPTAPAAPAAPQTPVVHLAPSAPVAPAAPSAPAAPANSGQPESK